MTTRPALRSAPSSWRCCESVYDADCCAPYVAPLLFLRREAQIHPSSSLWRRNPPAKCVVFTELLSTSRDVSVDAPAPLCAGPLSESKRPCVA